MQHEEDFSTRFSATMDSVFIFLLVWLKLATGQVHPAAQPNILFILADDLGWNDVSWNNPLMPMRNLHQLASNNALRMNNSYVNKLCSQTR